MAPLQHPWLPEGLALLLVRARWWRGLRLLPLALLPLVALRWCRAGGREMRWRPPGRPADKTQEGQREGGKVV